MKLTLGKVNAASVFIAWFGLVGFFVWFTYVLVTDNHVFDYLVLAVILVTVLGALVHFILSFKVRCPHCDSCLTIQGFKKPHPNSAGDWSVVVFKWFTGSVVCIHCGKKVDTRNI